MKINMMHNENILTFDDIACHLILEDKYLEAARSFTGAYVAKSSLRKVSDFKCKRKYNSTTKRKILVKHPKELRPSNTKSVIGISIRPR